MKIQKIVDICRKSGELYITKTKDAQWIGNGQAIYPLYDLPELSAEELCTIYSISEEQRDKMILNDRRESDYSGVDFGGVAGSENAAEVISPGILYGGALFVMLRCGDEINFVRRIYLAPFKEEVQFWRRECGIGAYYVITAGMFVKGIVFPDRDVRAVIAADIKEIAKVL